jgi:hypothetical protein
MKLEAMILVGRESREPIKCFFPADSLIAARADARPSRP